MSTSVFKKQLLRSISTKTMNIPGCYPDEHPILALWVEGGHIHARWSAWTVHCRQEESLLLRHTEGFWPPFKTREGELSATTYAGIIERLELISIPLISRPLGCMTDASHAGVAYSDTFLVRWYGNAPEGWEGLERWYSETVQLFERAMESSKQC